MGDTTDVPIGARAAGRVGCRSALRRGRQRALGPFSYYARTSWRFTGPLEKHGVAASDVMHAVEHEMVSFDLEPDADPPKILVIGPNSAGNVLEVIVLVLNDDRLIASTP